MLLKKSAHAKKIKLSKELKKAIGLGMLLKTVYSVVNQMGAFALTLATITFSKNFALSLVFLVIFLLREPIMKLFFTIIDRNEAFLQLRISEFLADIKTKILSKTRDKVNVVKNGRKQLMSSAVILDTVTEYLTKKYNTIVKLLMFIFDITIFIFSITTLITIAVKQTNNLPLFIFILAASSISMIIVSAFVSKSRNKLWEKSKEKYDNLKNAERDVQEIKPMSIKHIHFLLSNIVKAQKEITGINLKDRKKKNLEELLIALIIAVSLTFIVLSMMFTSNEENITSAVFMSSIAFGQAFSSVLSSITGEISLLYTIINQKKEYTSKYEKDYNAIMDVYSKEEMVVERAYQEENLVINPFKYTYPTTGFEIEQHDRLTLKRGKVILLDGKSGTGKSTFIKIISGEIRISSINWKLKSIKYFNDTSMLGTRNLLEEITLEEDENKVDVDKLFEILDGIQLSSKFKTLEQLKKNSVKELSNGLMQRALLARTLYNLEDSDLVCIDEPIGSLDEENAKKVISFTKEYCNREKSRFLILCTHQHIFVEELIDMKITLKPVSVSKSQIEF